MSHQQNEFEPVQSEAALRSLVQDLQAEIQSVKSTLQSAQDGFSKVNEILTSDSFKKILNVIDTGNDEAEAGTVQGESGARAFDRVLSADVSQLGVNALNSSISGSILHSEERSGIRTNNFMAQSSDDRFWTNLVRFKAVSGEVDPDSLVTVLRALGKEQDKE